MSMKMLTILQFLCVFGLYSFVAILLPALVFHRKLRGERPGVRFLFYLITGNFFCMNIVFVLQLLHISNRVTLTGATVLLAGYGLIYTNDISLGELAGRTVENISHLLKGTLGYRSLLRRISKKLKEGNSHIYQKARYITGHYFWECIFVTVLTVILLWFYGSNLVVTMGYCASDIPVHNYWINAMSENEIFVSGVYPFGFHCIIYYLHTVFGIETFVLLRVFCVVQTLFIHYVLLIFIRLCCKSKYMAYNAVALYVLASFFNSNTYIRYYSSLPQEFGMIFILPSIYFLFAFFEVRKKEEQKALRTKSTGYLWGFAMSFSMTLAVHFYDTMVAGIFCLGIAIGYGFRLFRKHYFFRVMLAGILSVLIAVLPMGIAYASGTPLQGSLNWGMSVMAGGEEADDSDSDEDKEAEEQETQAQEDTVSEKGSLSEQQGIQAVPESTGDAQNVGDGSRPEGTGSIGQKAATVLGGIAQYAGKAADYIWWAFKTNVVNTASDSLCRFIFFTMGIAGVFGLIGLLDKDRDYGARLLSTFFGMVLLLIVLISHEIGIPELMDKGRISIYIAYMLPVVFAFSTDALLNALLGRFSKVSIINASSLLLTVTLVGMLVEAGKVRMPSSFAGYETNDAIICLTNILRENKDFTFTICSSNDELRMVEDYGYHYETIEFLKESEGARWRKNFTIPTKYIYFFIEKIPLDYDSHYDGSGQRISEEGAKRALPGGSGIDMYKGENRWIVMSRMYYWAKAFQDLYKTEMKVYYETESFVCYRLEQNLYNLYDLSIDYKFNTMSR